MAKIKIKAVPKMQTGGYAPLTSQERDAWERMQSAAYEQGFLGSEHNRQPGVDFMRQYGVDPNRLSAYQADLLEQRNVAPWGRPGAYMAKGPETTFSNVDAFYGPKTARERYGQYSIKEGNKPAVNFGTDWKAATAYSNQLEAARQAEYKDYGKPEANINYQAPEAPVTTPAPRATGLAATGFPTREEAITKYKARKASGQELPSNYFTGKGNADYSIDSLRRTGKGSDEFAYGGSTKKIRISGVPTMATGGYANKDASHGYGNQQLGQSYALNRFWNTPAGYPFTTSKVNPYGKVGNTLPEAKDGGDINAEKQEMVLGDFDQDGQQELMNVDGPPHTQGGKDVNVPSNSFVFSDTKDLKIKDPQILAMFGMAPKRGGYTPAQIAKKYDLNKFKKILDDPNADDASKKTAQLMNDNYLSKLNRLASVQESMKGAMGMEHHDPQRGQVPAEEAPVQEVGNMDQGGTEMMQPEEMMMEYGGAPKYQTAGIFNSKYTNFLNSAKQDLQKLYPGKSVNIVETSTYRHPSTQAGLVKKGASTTDVSLHAVNAAKDFQILVNGKPVNDPELYHDVLWKNAERNGLYHLDPKGFGAKDLGHIGVIEEDGKSTYGRLIDAYPQIKNTKEFNALFEHVKNRVGSGNPTPKELLVYNQLQGQRYEPELWYKPMYPATENATSPLQETVTKSKVSRPVNLPIKKGILTAREVPVPPVLQTDTDNENSNVNINDWVMSEYKGQIQRPTMQYAGLYPTTLQSLGTVPNWQEAIPVSQWTPNTNANQQVAKTVPSPYKMQPSVAKQQQNPELPYNEFLDIVGRNPNLDRLPITGPSSPYSLEEYPVPWAGTNYQMQGQEVLPLRPLSVSPQTSAATAVNVPPMTPFVSTDTEALVTNENKKKNRTAKQRTGIFANPNLYGDVMNLAQMAQLRKFVPYEPVPQAVIPETVFMDPTRAIAAQQEMARNAMEMAGQSANARAARATGLAYQGEAGKQAADTIAQYANQNVAIANQANAQAAQITNQLMAMEANRMAELNKGNFLAARDYQREMGRLQAEWADRKQKQHDTAVKTAWLNKTSPYFNIDPYTQMPVFKPGDAEARYWKDIKGGSDGNFPDMISKLMSEKGWSFEQALAALTKGTGTVKTQHTDPVTGDKTTSTGTAAGKYGGMMRYGGSHMAMPEMAPYYQIGGNFIPLAGGPDVSFNAVDNTAYTMPVQSTEPLEIETEQSPLKGLSSKKASRRDIATITNNPGNMIYSPKFGKLFGAVDSGIKQRDGKGHFAMFPDLNTGFKAYQTQLFGEVDGVMKSNYYKKDTTVNQALKTWSNNGYDGSIYPEVKNKKLSELTMAERNELAKRQIKHESGDMYKLLRERGVFKKYGGSALQKFIR